MRHLIAATSITLAATSIPAVAEVTIPDCTQLQKFPVVHIPGRARDGSADQTMQRYFGIDLNELTQADIDRIIEASLACPNISESREYFEVRWGPVWTLVVDRNISASRQREDFPLEEEEEASEGVDLLIPTFDDRGTSSDVRRILAGLRETADTAGGRDDCRRFASFPYEELGTIIENGQLEKELIEHFGYRLLDVRDEALSMVPWTLAHCTRNAGASVSHQRDFEPIHFYLEERFEVINAAVRYIQELYDADQVDAETADFRKPTMDGFVLGNHFASFEIVRVCADAGSFFEAREVPVIQEHIQQVIDRHDISDEVMSATWDRIQTNMNVHGQGITELDCQRTRAQLAAQFPAAFRTQTTNPFAR